MENTVSIVFGESQRERIELTVLGRSHPTSADYWDGNWLRTKVAVQVGGFAGTFAADLRAEEFRSFRDQLARLYETLDGEATFTTMEGQVLLVLAGDGIGHVSVSADLVDAAGIGNRLHCELAIDQTYLAAVLDSLDAVDAAWPVLGRP